MRELKTIFIEQGFKEKGHELEDQSIKIFVDNLEKSEIYFIKEISSVESAKDVIDSVDKILLDYQIAQTYSEAIKFNTNFILYVTIDNQSLFQNLMFLEKNPYNARKIIIRKSCLEQDKNLLPFVSFNLETENLELTIEEDIEKLFLNSNITKEDPSYWFARFASEDFNSSEIIEKVESGPGNE